VARLEENGSPPNKLMEEISSPVAVSSKKTKVRDWECWMSSQISRPAIRGLQVLYEWGAMGNWTDGQLIARFVGGDETSEEAFRILIHRHGPMVLGVCRRVLGDQHAADDAFQLTFLIFVKKAGALRDRGLLTNWLYGVALRVAKKERSKGARRDLIERRAAETEVVSQSDHDEIELRSVIDEEIRRLPERYRLPLVLCHVEGLRHEEVAHRLGCPIGTVESRLSRARQQLRARLTRRGLSPTASVIAAVLRPPALKPLAASLAEATLRAAVKVTTPHAGRKLTSLSAISWMRPIPAVRPAIQMGAIASVVVAFVAGLAMLSVAIYKAAGEPTRIDRTDARARSTKVPLEPIRPSRFPSAIAQPLADITIDGRLDDWPSDLQKYPIRNKLVDHPSYDSTEAIDDSDSSDYFMAGYDQKAGLLYLAVVVHDDDIVVHPSDPRGTDAVEVYVDGTFSNRSIPHPDGDWREALDARTMPVLQYVGVPGRAAAYGDRWRANPSLVYARQKESRTRMQFQRTGDVITYEWAVTTFDSFPEKPTQLVPGKRLGLDIAVLDKDKKKSSPTSRQPSFRTWGAAPVEFKGCDAGSLGELILEQSPPP
jgi:RNA polymerase sigma factor (sigma-70 family)